MTTVTDVPAPGVSRTGLQIITHRSLISAGTERMLVEFGRAGWLDKARQQPEKVQQVLDKVRADGLMTTVDAVRSKLDQTVPLGYCNVGVAVSVGTDAGGFSIGDRVVSNGPHAEVVSVAKNLCAKIPKEVSDDHAAFTVLAAIGLQGMRLATPTLGEAFVVTGLGLIGLLTVQMLRANGCKVLGIDPDPSKTALARKFGAQTVELSRNEDPIIAAAAFSDGRGVDGVIITAATKSSEPVIQAARMCRKRGRIILVGVAGLELNRSDLYEKELSFQVSCSYGPGRYDPAYEDDGHDYPIGFVRWTEQRNFEAVLDMMAAGTLNVAELITHRFDISDAPRAYDLLTNATEAYLGILLQYPENPGAGVLDRSIKLEKDRGPPTSGDPVVSVIGSGNYASRILIPALAKAGARFVSIASSGGVTASRVGRKHGFAEVSTNPGQVISDKRSNTVVVATRHDSHARYVCAALAAGKHAFVEKPLALTEEEIESIVTAWEQTAGRLLLMVGFNRRFAPQIIRMKSLLETVRTPKTFVFTVNAGALPATHWTQSADIGGGRMIGEGCHFIDLMRYLADSKIESWKASHIGGVGEGGIREDKASVTLSFEDGSIGTLHYFANGHGSYPKERIEVFCAGRVLQLDNYLRLRGYGWRGFRKMNLWKQDKGQAACAAAFMDAVRAGKESPIPFSQLIEVARVTIAVGQALRH